MADPSRSEPATPKRRQEAREKGQVVKSQELIAAVMLLAAFALLSWTGSSTFHSLEFLFRRLWGPDPYRLDFTLGGLQDAAIAGAVFLAGAIGPMLLALWVIAILSNVVQIGILFSAHPLQPKLSNLNPFEGAKRVFSQRMLFELGKALLKVLLVSWIGYLTIHAEWTSLQAGAAAGPGGVLTEIARVSVLLGLRVAGVLLLLAALDYAYQRWQFEQNLKMTRQEIRDEMRQLEGDPLIKARIRQIQREMARRRMFEEVPTADVIITNPEHFAVALRYTGATMRAPKVVAKGAGVIAERIKEIGRAHGVTMVENVPLAQALYKTARVGDEIPPDFYQTIAEVIAYVYQVTKRETLLVPKPAGAA